MAEKRGGIRIARVMGLVALIAAVIKWPPLVLFALPFILYLGSKALGLASSIVAAVFSLCSLILCGAVCLLWVRSYGSSDHLAWRSDGGWRSARSARGHVVIGLGSAVWTGRPAGSQGLEYQRGEACPPFLPFILMGPEEGDRVNSWERCGFAWYEKRNARLGTFVAGGFAPYWYLAVVTAAPPLWWAAMRWRACGRGRGAVPRSSVTEAAAKLRPVADPDSPQGNLV